LTEPTERILAHLEELGFEVRSGWAEPFGEHLPLVTGVAWDTECAQVTLIAEGEGSLAPEPWRQLLFAGSGIRHQLAGDEASAFGTPVIIAIVDPQASGELRALAEGLSREYAVFSRVDLNVVLQADVHDDERLDDALAPLLPRCRRTRGSEISKREVQKFWALLRVEVEGAAAGLDEIFGDRRAAAGREGAEALLGDSPDSAGLPAPVPIREVKLRRFRSIELADLGLAGVNVINGPNGGGKTSLVEALELAWAGTSQRKPPDVEADEYAAHLPLDGAGAFSIEADGRLIEGVSSEPRAELARCVLTQEAMAALASEAPKERFATLLTVAGLEIPDVKSRTEALLRQSKAEVDKQFSTAGMANLQRMDRVGLRHLREELESEFADRFAALPEISSIEAALVSISGGAFRPRHWKAEAGVRAALKAADRAVAEAGERRSETPVGPTLDEAGELVAGLLEERVQTASGVGRLLEALRAQFQAERAPQPSEEATHPPSPTEAPPPIGVELASRWLRSAVGLRQSAERFVADAAAIEDPGWAERLRAYAGALEQAAGLAPSAELEVLSTPTAPPVPKLEVKADPEVQQAAGFTEAPIDAVSVGPVLRELADALDAHVATLRDLGGRLERHPARNVGEHWEGLMDSICRFELARTLRREGPIQQASERMVSELLDERLRPVVAELMAAIVRFEWYFRPLRMSTEKRQVRLGGLATDREDLDARLLLNSAEKAVLGLAWFLALHMLQPEERRRVLVLDDPTSAFDTLNTAGFTSTLRALTRLLRPEQVVIATHSDRVAVLLSEEMAGVDGWPAQVRRTRFQRNAKFRSEAIEEWAGEDQCDTGSELERLGLLESAGTSKPDE
jgi:hypothetical protein